MNIKRHIKLLALLLFLPWVLAAQAESGPEEYVFAKLIEQGTLQYPIRERAADTECWIYYQHAVNDDGEVTDLDIVDSCGRTSFVQEAKKYLKTRRYSPATLNGVPVAETQRVALITWVLDDKPRDAGRGFASRFNRARKLIEQGQTDDARKEIDKLAKTDRKVLYEELYLQILLETYYEAIGDAHKRYQHALRVLDFNDYKVRARFLTPEAFIPYLAVVYEYEVSSNRLADAISTAEQIIDIGVSDAAADLLRARSVDYQRLIEGKTLAIPVTLEEPVWGGEMSYDIIRLMRLDFEITDVSSEEMKFELWCDKGKRRLGEIKNIAFSIPAGWGACSVFASGPVGATLTVNDLPGLTKAVTR